MEVTNQRTTNKIIFFGVELEGEWFEGPENLRKGLKKKSYLFDICRN